MRWFYLLLFFERNRTIGSSTYLWLIWIWSRLDSIRAGWWEDLETSKEETSTARFNHLADWHRLESELTGEEVVPNARSMPRDALDVEVLRTEKDRQTDRKHISLMRETYCYCCFLSADDEHHNTAGWLYDRADRTHIRSTDWSIIGKTGSTCSFALPRLLSLTPMSLADHRVASDEWEFTSTIRMNKYLWTVKRVNIVPLVDLRCDSDH